MTEDIIVGEKKINKKRSKVKQLNELNVEDVMDDRIWDLSILPRDEKISSLVKIISTADHVWIVDNLKNNRLVGIMNERDVLEVIKPKKRFHLSKLTTGWRGYFDMDEEVSTYMDDTYLTARTKEKILDVISEMRLHQKLNCAVIDDKKHIVGEISFRRILQIYLKMHKY